MKKLKIILSLGAFALIHATSALAYVSLTVHNNTGQKLSYKTEGNVVNSVNPPNPMPPGESKFWQATSWTPPIPSGTLTISMPNQQICTVSMNVVIACRQRVCGPYEDAKVINNTPYCHVTVSKETGFGDTLYIVYDKHNKKSQ